MILFNIFLILHITGIVIIAGTTLTTYFIAKQFWKFIQTNKPRAVIINSTNLFFGKLTAIGGMLTILSGIIMVIVLHGALVSQIWFRVKMILVVMIILNASVFARVQNKKLEKLLAVNINTIHQLNPIKSKMNLYYVIQCILLIAIFVLSVFRFK